MIQIKAGIVHSFETTTAKTHDSQIWDGLLQGDETPVWADKGHVSATREAAFSGPGKFWGCDAQGAEGQWAASHR